MQEPSSDTDVPLARWRDRVQSRVSTAPAQSHGLGQKANEALRTISEASQELGLSVHTVRTWVAARRIAHVRLGRAIRIPASEIRRVIEDNTVPAVKER